jgi:hypothetical protein
MVRCEWTRRSRRAKRMGDCGVVPSASFPPGDVPFMAALLAARRGRRDQAQPHPGCALRAHGVGPANIRGRALRRVGVVGGPINHGEALRPLRADFERVLRDRQRVLGARECQNETRATRAYDRVPSALADLLGVRVSPHRSPNASPTAGSFHTSGGQNIGPGLRRAVT